MKFVISMLILLVLDIVVFIATLNVTRKYIKEQRIISDNLETLILSFETTKHLSSPCYVATKVDGNTFFDFCTLFKSQEKNLFYIIPDSLYHEFHIDDDYEELYRL